MHQQHSLHIGKCVAFEQMAALHKIVKTLKTQVVNFKFYKCTKLSMKSPKTGECQF